MMMVMLGDSITEGLEDSCTFLTWVFEYALLCCGTLVCMVWKIGVVFMKFTNGWGDGV